MYKIECNEALQERKTVVGESGNLLRPARLCVAGGIAPRVVVEGEEVTALIIGTAVHVSGHVVSVAVDIGSRVSDRDGSVAPAVTVLLEIASDGLDVWGTDGSSVIVDDLVTAVEEQSVGVRSEGINCSEDALKVDSVVRSCRASTVQ